MFVDVDVCVGGDEMLCDFVIDFVGGVGYDDVMIGEKLVDWIIYERNE